jgi:gas vesicle protein
MLVPMNFAVGALVGAAAAYIYKDEPTKEALSGTAVKLKNMLFKKKAEAVEDQNTDSVEVIEDAVTEAASEEAVEATKSAQKA